MIKSSKIKIFAYPGMYSYWLEALLKWSDVACQFEYTKSFPADCGDISDTYEVILFNLPLTKNHAPKMMGCLEGLMNQPFSDVYVVGNYVDEEILDLPVVGNNGKDKSPLTQFFDLLEANEPQRQRIGATLSKAERYIVQSLEEGYQLNPSSMTRTLEHLANFWKDNLKIIPRVDTKDKLYKLSGNLIVKREAKNEQEYLDKKLPEIREYTNGTHSLAFVYAEQYLDSLAREYFKQNKSDLLLIGNHTRQDDIIHVRTATGSGALDVAQLFREQAKGDERRAMFFLQNTPANIAQVLSTFYFEEK